MTVHFTRDQIEYIVKKTGCDDPNDAMETFIAIITEERVQHDKIHVYLKKLMERDRGR